MGLVETDRPDVIMKYSMIKLNELAASYYDLCDEFKFLFISILMQYIFNKYVFDKCKTDEKFRRRVARKESITVDIKNVLYMFNSSRDAVIMVQVLSMLRNKLSHSYNVPSVMSDLSDTWEKDSSMRAVCDCLGINMQRRAGFDAAITMAGE